MTVGDAVAGRPADRSAYERALADPGYLARIREAYRGDDDVLDALRWLDAPNQAGPSGAPSPTAALEAAKRQLYAPGAPPEAAERFAALRRTADQSRETALAAVRAVGDRAGRAPTPETPPADDHPAPPPPAAHPARRTIALALAGPLVAVAAVLGLVLGLTVERPAAPAAVPTDPIVAHFEQTVAGADALSVFDQRQRDYDLPGGVAGSLDTSTARRLLVVGSARLFAVRTTSTVPAAVCLLVVDDGAHVSGSCAAVPEFYRAGLTLERPGDRLPDGIRRIRWYPDGRVVWWAPPR